MTCIPENARTLTLKQADIIVIPSADWIPFDRLVDKFLPARAAENCVYLAYCNRVGVENEFRFFGKSRVVDPSGNTVCQGTDQEELLTAEVDSTLPRQVKEEMGFLRDRRPQVYGRS
jgi:predicted amidohydrolase